MGQGSTMNQSVMAGDPAHQELLKRKTLFKGGQRTQEESTTIAVISKDFKKTLRKFRPICQSRPKIKGA